DDVEDWNENIMLGVSPVSVPAPEDMDPFSSGEYWQRADLRLVLQLNGSGAPDTTNSPTGVEVVNVNGSTDATATSWLHHATCPGNISHGGSNYPVGTRGPSSSSKLRLFREHQYDNMTNNYERTLEVDMQALLDCIERHPEIMGGKALSDDTEEGLVFHMTVSGPASSNAQNNYAVRIRHGSRLQSSVSGAAVVKGLTLVTDQKLVIWGDYNTVGWIPAALMADTLWLLSNNWVDSDSELMDRYDRDGNATTVYAAVLSGIRRTGNANGPAGQDHGMDSNGGGAIN